MGGDPVSFVLRHLLARTRLSPAESVTDGVLVQRFAAGADEAAFEALVRRHGPAILKVCRCLLRNEADVEDVFQATFLVLARKAGSIRKQDSVGSFLHGVAQRIALNVRVRSARRRVRERQAVDMPRPETRDEAEHEELCALLREELQHVTEEYRAALVLFYLEGKSYEETAQVLHCPVGTVRSRLARGRDVLRSRLADRGVVASGATCVPAGLLAATVKAAGANGLGASARVLELVEEALRGLALVKMKSTLVVLVAVGMLAAVAGLLIGRDQHPAQPGKSTDRLVPSLAAGGVAPAAAGATRLDVAGRVLDPAGKPVSGAAVLLREWTVWPGAVPATDVPATDILARTRTDERGQFAFHGVFARPFSLAWQSTYHPWDIVVQAPGQALAWRHLSEQVRQAGPITIRLERAAQVRGRLMDTAGRPVPRAMVRIDSLAPLAAGASGCEGTLWLRNSRVVLQAQSDAEGRFLLDGLPGGMRAHLAISSATHLEQTLQAATTDDPVPNRVTELFQGGKKYLWLEPTLSGDWTATLRPGRRVRGRVLAADTGEPVPGALLRAIGVTATADEQGRFSIGPVPLGDCWVCASDPAQKTLLGLSSRVKPARESEETELAIRLPRGIRLSGRVAAEDTGQGLAQADVRYQLGGNRPGTTAFVAMCKTNAKGRFQLVVPAGAGKLLVSGGSSGFPGVQERTLDLKPGQRSADVTVVLRRGVAVRGRVVDLEGHGVKGAEVKLEYASMPDFPPWGCLSGDDGTFSLGGLPADSGFEWVATHSSRRLGARLPQVLPKGRKDPLPVTIRLAPLAGVTGRAQDTRQTPLRGATVRVIALVRVPYKEQPEEREIATRSADAGGRFHIHVLPCARHRYLVEVSAPGHLGLRSPAFEMQPGQARALAELLLPPARASVSGIVLGPDGKPLADVRVRPLPVSGNAALIWPAAVVTTRDGRFRLTGLPAGLVELDAEECVPGEHDPGKPAGPTTRVKVEAGPRTAAVVLRLEARAR
jgi:RNA polymerase sigma factor (sigma-70 family)